MTQVNIITSENAYGNILGLEEQINTFCKNHKVKIIDIKYSTCYKNSSVFPCIKYSAMIIYEMEEEE